VTRAEGSDPGADSGAVPGADPGADSALHDRLSRIWAPPPGLLGFFTAVNHRVVGLRFMVTAFIFFLLAGLLAVAVRLQLSLPMLGVLSPDAYNQAFTMHGSAMMFLFVVPFVEGLAIYLIPLMIGAREMAFPRLNAFGYWVFLVAGVSLFGAYLGGVAPDSGWYNYPPLTGRAFRPGASIDFWVTMITFLEVSALVAAVEIIATILKHRTPGLALHRLPIFVWAMFVTALMIVFAMPALVLASLMLGLDRWTGTHFFNVLAGGDPILWQHLFWFFGHPDVYIMLLPAVGVVSMIIPAFARRPLAAYTLVVTSIVIIGLLSFGVWVHHMYTVGLAVVGLNFFAAASMLITIPSAIQILSWITTIWLGRLGRLTSAMLFSVGFIILFILGGITGIMIAAVPFNWQVHDTYFIVAHFHFTLVGGVIFPIFAAIYFWFPKVTGRMLNERLGRWHFWLFLTGFNMTFLLMHLTGLQGMPRRVYTYLPGLGWDWLNMLSTAGALVMGVAVVLFVWNLVTSWRSGPEAGRDPWGGETLEWATASPPPNYNFLAVPIVGDRSPMWNPVREEESGDGARPPWLRELEEAPDLLRETIVTSILAARPEGKVVLPGPSPWPFWLAMALTIAFLGAVWTLLFVPVGLALAFVALVGWHWPRDIGDRPDTDMLPEEEAP
jgi:cytochrome c oxidase subunit I+III